MKARYLRNIQSAHSKVQLWAESFYVVNGADPEDEQSVEYCLRRFVKSNVQSNTFTFSFISTILLHLSI